jgi:hypothetical protein
MHFYGHPADQMRIDYELQKEVFEEKQKITAIAAHRELIEQIEKYLLSEKIKINAICVNKKSNLLLWRKEQHHKQQKKVVLIGTLFLILIFLSCVILNIYLKNETHRLSLNSKKINDKVAKIILHHPHQKIALLQKLEQWYPQKKSSIRLNKNAEFLLSIIANNLPNDVTLTTLEINHKIKLTGKSDQLPDIHHYASVLKQHLTEKQVQLSEISNDLQNKSEMDFAIVVTS